MSGHSPALTIHYGRPRSPNTGELIRDEHATWIDDGTTAGAADGDLCIIHNGVIRIYNTVVTAPV